jgi:serine phosphatase RsbU (regulator of sigma subunit)
MHGVCRARWQRRIRHGRADQELEDELRDAIVQAVTEFSRGDFHDDVTLVVVGMH